MSLSSNGQVLLIIGFFETSKPRGLVSFLSELNELISVILLYLRNNRLRFIKDAKGVTLEI